MNSDPHDWYIVAPAPDTSTTQLSHQKRIAYERRRGPEFPASYRPRNRSRPSIRYGSRASRGWCSIDMLSGGVCDNQIDHAFLIIWHKARFDGVIPFTHVCAFAIVNADPLTRRNSKLSTKGLLKRNLISEALAFHRLPLLPTPLLSPVWAQNLWLTSFHAKH
jgi:hypothetical protein